MAVDPGGLVYACDWHRGEVVRVTTATGQVETYTRGAPDLPIDDPNSPVFAEDGTMYVTGSKNPAIFLVAPGGETVVWTTAVGGYPNGVPFDVEGNCYVAHYTPDRIDRIHPDGTVTTLVEDWEAVYLNAPTNVAFCGSNLEFLAAACVGEEFLATADIGTRGWPLRRPRLS
jgi:sugar lactone lactonase YvrE